MGNIHPSERSLRPDTTMMVLIIPRGVVDDDNNNKIRGSSLDGRCITLIKIHERLKITFSDVENLLEYCHVDEDSEQTQRMTTSTTTPIGPLTSSLISAAFYGTHISICYNM